MTDSRAIVKLKAYLLAHERDIAMKAKDYGELTAIFRELHKRLPVISAAKTIPYDGLITIKVASVQPLSMYNKE